MERYTAACERSIEDAEGFWAEAAEAVDFHQPWPRVPDDSGPLPLRQAGVE